MTDKPAAVAHVRRPALRYNKELATQFGIDPDSPDPPRELVRVDSIPDPPPVAVDAKAIRDGRRNDAAVSPSVDIESAVVHAVTEEMDELAVRLERYGVALPPSSRQQLVDTAMALLGGAIRPGGVTSGR